MTTTTVKPKIQIDDLVREMNDEEFAIYEANRKADEATELARLADEQAKAAHKQALLNRLGITEEEAQLLIAQSETPAL